MAISLGSLIVELKANTASFVEGMDKMAQLSAKSAKDVKQAFATIGTIVAGAAAGVEAALVEMVDRSAESAAKLYEMSQASGVSVEALSSLQYAAKQSGLDVESLEKGLTKLSKSAYAAASAPAGAVTAYKQLGVAVTDASGQMKAPQSILLDLAEKFAGMKDGAAKTALAMQIFGKSGAEMIPFLNRGKEGIKELTDEADRLGITLDTKTAQGARQFEENLTKLEGVAQGFGNTVLKGLLPTLNLLSENIARGAEDESSHMRDLISLAGYVGKAFITAFSFVQTVLDQTGVTIKGIGAALYNLARRDFKGVAESIREARAENDQIWKEYTAGVHLLFNPTQAPTKTDTRPNAPTKPVKDRTNPIVERIERLRAQTIAEGKLANAIGETTAETVQATAAAEAQKAIDELNALGKQKNLRVSREQEASIRRLTLLLLSYKEALDVNKQLDAQHDKTELATKATLELARAYGESAAAIVAAEEKAKLAPFAKHVSELEGTVAALKKLGATDKQLDPLISALGKARQRLSEEAKATHELAVAQQELNASQEGRNLDVQIGALKGYTAAILGGTEAMRRFNIEQQVVAFARANPNLDPSAYDKLRDRLTSLDNLQQDNAAAQSVRSLERYRDVDNEIEHLERLRDAERERGKSTTAIDAQIHQLKLQRIRDYDDELLKIGSLKGGVKAFFTEYVNDAQTAGEKVFVLLSKSFSGLEDNLAKVITGQKASWKQMLQQMEADLAKSAVHDVLSSGVKKLGGLFGVDLGGLSKPDGTRSNPLYVKSVDAKLGIGGIGGGNSGDGSDDGTSAFEKLSKLGHGIASVFGKIGGFFKDHFGGFRENGGDMTPGKAYIVGERRPEVVMSKTGGTVLPFVPRGSGRPPIHFSPTYVFPNSNPDAFRKAQGQTIAEAYMHASLAATRNG